MTSDERWLPIKEFPGYEVSDHGRVRSVDREVGSRWGTPRAFKGKMLSQSLIGGSGKAGRYPACTLFRDGKSKQVTVHVLVLTTFVGPRPEKGTHGCHRDDNPMNNHLDNLYWGTPRQNARDAVNNGSSWKANITHCPQGHEYTEANTYIVPSTGHRQCRTCIKAKNKGNANSTRTHCPQGHPYDEENTYRVPGKNNRMCKTCMRDRSREYQRNKYRDRPRRPHQGEVMRAKTVCPQGHPYSPENTYTNPNNGRRHCRICQAAAGARHRARKRAERHREG